MAADGVRMDAYARAIQRTVRPGSIVVDIGAGTGIFSLLAARAGARKVHAVDPNPAIWMTADLARENGLADRIQVHHATSYELELAPDEKADVVVSDLRGSMPPHEQHFAVLRDARRRLLAPGGVLIPQHDELLVAVFENDEFARDLARAAIGFERRGFSAKATSHSLLNTPTFDGSAVRSSDLLTDGATWGSVTYGTDQAKLEGEVDLTCRRGGIAHGLVLWFEATIFEDLRFATPPGSSTVYARVVLPLAEAVTLEAGDRAHVALHVDETGGRWAWDTAFRSADGTSKSRQRQASFFGVTTSPSALLRSASGFAPSLADRGARAKRILELMTGTHTVAAIADEIHSAMQPTSVPRAAILEEVRELVSLYAR
jgi:protein arginine N-methyltransferase 1